MVLCGPLSDALVAQVRSAARVRALGVRACDARSLSAQAPLDLLVVGPGDDVSTLAVSAAKIVYLVDSDADFSGFGHRASGVLACGPTQVLRFALGLAALGRAE